MPCANHGVAYGIPKLVVKLAHFTVKILGRCRRTTPFRTLPAQLVQVFVCFSRVSAGRASLLNFRQKTKFLKRPHPSRRITLHDQRFIIYR